MVPENMKIVQDRETVLFFLLLTQVLFFGWPDRFFVVG